MPWIKLSAEITADAAEPCAAALEAAGAQSVEFGEAGDRPVLEPAPGETPLWSAVRISALFPAGTDLAPHLGALAATAGIDPAAWRVETLEDQAWERAWLRDFHAMRFGRRLWILPGDTQAPDADAVTVRLDPGLAFGTGTHPTTALCLKWLDQAAISGRTVCDYGCGSGILAVAALRLGASRATATDIDPQALLATRENAERNGVLERLDIRPPERLRETEHDVVIANILASPLEQLARRIAGLARPGGMVVLSGLMPDQADEVSAAYTPWVDWSEPAVRDGWVRLNGRRNGAPAGGRACPVGTR